MMAFFLLNLRLCSRFLEGNCVLKFISLCIDHQLACKNNCADYSDVVRFQVILILICLSGDLLKNSRRTNFRIYSECCTVLKRYMFGYVTMHKLFHRLAPLRALPLFYKSSQTWKTSSGPKSFCTEFIVFVCLLFYDIDISYLVV